MSRDRYELIEIIGEGAFAVAWRARDRETGEEVCLKILSPFSDEDARRRFTASCAVAIPLRHPGIVRTLDAGIDGDQGWVAMDLVEGEELAELLARDGALSTARTLGLMTQVLEALAHAHRRRVVHRDLKPANIMVDEGDLVTLLDLGFARPFSRDESREASFAGTPQYMAPEQYMGDRVDGAADMYAWGLVVGECLTGRAFWEGGSESIYAARDLEDDGVEAPDPLPEWLDDGLRMLLERCRAVDPALRPTATQALAIIQPMMHVMSGKNPPRGKSQLGERAVGEMSRYERLEQIGTGSFASAYRALDRETGAEVCLKVLSPFKNDAAAKRFETSCEVSKRLRHPGIVQMLDHGVDEEGTTPWVAMALAPGEELASLLKREERLDLTRTLKLMIQVLEALSHAHRMQVVHRDLKPANIMVDDQDRVVILDLGFARPFSREESEGASRAGTPRYMAPEQYAGERVDGGADMYAWSLITNQCLVGSFAWQSFVGSSVHDSEIGSAVSPWSSNGWLDEGLRDVLEQCRAFDPALRPSATQALDILEPMHQVLLDDTPQNREVVEAALARLPALPDPFGISVFAASPEPTIPEEIVISSGSVDPRSEPWIGKGLVAAIAVAALGVGVWQATKDPVQVPAAVSEGGEEAGRLRVEKGKGQQAEGGSGQLEGLIVEAPVEEGKGRSDPGPAPAHTPSEPPSEDMENAKVSRKSALVERANVQAAHAACTQRTTLDKCRPFLMMANDSSNVSAQQIMRRIGENCPVEDIENLDHQDCLILSFAHEMGLGRPKDLAKAKALKERAYGD